MKQLILVRHAHALDCLQAGVHQDALRPLSPQGLNKAAQTAQKLKTAACRPELILHSPLVRACQTADILAHALNAPLQACPELDGMHSDQDVCDFLLEQMNSFSCLMAVGHNPNISAVLYLLAEQSKHFSPGSFARVDMLDLKQPKLTDFED